jgi:hypothetical protein
MVSDQALGTPPTKSKSKSRKARVTREAETLSSTRGSFTIAEKLKEAQSTESNEVPCKKN